jgi:hypothetical protein
MRRRTRVGILSGFLTVLASTALPCSCPPLAPGATHAAPFLDVAPGSDLVVVAEVLRYSGKRHTSARIPEAMDVAVRQVFKGAERRSTLRLRGDTGVLCRPYVTKFAPGTVWVFALHRAPEKRGEYALSACGEHWLRVTDDRVRGYIHSDPSQTGPEVEVALSDLRSLLGGETSQER